MCNRVCEKENESTREIGEDMLEVERICETYPMKRKSPSVV